MSITAIAPLPMNPTLQSVLTHLKHALADLYGDRLCAVQCDLRFSQGETPKANAAALRYRKLAVDWVDNRKPSIAFFRRRSEFEVCPK